MLINRKILFNLKRGKMTRLESASSINTFNTCKRKYYYSYKLNLPKRESVATLTGKAVHTTLERFFKIDITNINKSNYELELKHYLLNLFNVTWSESLIELLKLENDKETIRKYYTESLFMLQNFLIDFIQELKSHNMDFSEAFNKLKPKTEVYLSSDKYQVQGYIDCILKMNDQIFIIDYKTSSKDVLSDDYLLQLSIYSLLFNESYGKFPNKVGLHFLRHGTKKFIDVTPDMVANAIKQCELIQINTESDDINPGFYCKWRNGQCSFYDICFGIKKLNDFDNSNDVVDLVQIKKE